MMRKLLGIAIILLVVVAVGIGIVVIYIDSIAKSAIERGATASLGVATTLESADVGILSGEFSMTQLNVANPEGYQSPHFINLDAGSVQVSFGTLREETVLLPHLTLGGIDMNLESRGGKANYDVILANLKKGEETEEPTADESSKRFVIEKVTITDVNVHIDMLPQGGALTRTSLPIDRIELTNVGSESGRGVLLSDLSGVLVKAILTAVVNKAGELPGLGLDGLKQGLSQLESVGDLGVKFAGESLQNIAGGLGGEAGKAVDDAGKQIQKGLDDLGKGLGGLLGGEKKSDDNGGGDDGQ